MTQESPLKPKTGVAQRSAAAIKTITASGFSR